MKFFGKFKHSGNKHTSRSTSCTVEDNSISTVLSPPTSMYRLGPDENTCVDVELYHTGEVMRICGFDESTTCMDFMVNLCQRLKLKPSLYGLMVRDKHNLSTWQRTPPSSKLGVWLEGVSDKFGAPLRLVYKSYVNQILKPGLSNWRPKNVQAAAEPMSGREMLEQMGARILVYLPGDRKVVIRSRLSHPVAEAISEVCSQRHLCPTDYFLQNPRTGVALDPSLTFNDQHITEFELKPCRPESSNLTALNVRPQKSIDEPASDAKLRHLSSSGPPVSHKRLRSPVKSRIYANGQRPHTFCAGYPAQPRESGSPIYSRPLSTVFAKSHKKRMAPPPPTTPLESRSSVQEEQPHKRPHTRSAHTVSGADFATTTSSGSQPSKFRRHSASLKGSPFFPRSILFSTCPEQVIASSSEALSPGSLSYSESFLPQSARAFEPDSEDYPPIHSVSAVSLPLTIIKRLDHSSGIDTEEPHASVAALPESVVASTSYTVEESSFARDDKEPLAVQVDVETKLGPSSEQQPDASQKENRSSPPIGSEVKEAQASETKEKPSVPPRPSIEVLLQHPKYRHMSASVAVGLTRDKDYPEDSEDHSCSQQGVQQLSGSGDALN